MLVDHQNQYRLLFSDSSCTLVAQIKVWKSLSRKKVEDSRLTSMVKFGESPPWSHWADECPANKMYDHQIGHRDRRDHWKIFDLLWMLSKCSANTYRQASKHKRLNEHPVIFPRNITNAYQSQRTHSKCLANVWRSLIIFSNFACWTFVSASETRP